MDDSKIIRFCHLQSFSKPINTTFLRPTLNFYQLQVANEINLSSNQFGRIERAETNPTVESIVKFCNFFKIDILDVFTKLSDAEENDLEIKIIELQKEFKNHNRRKS